MCVTGLSESVEQTVEARTFKLFVDTENKLKDRAIETFISSVFRFNFLFNSH